MKFEPQNFLGLKRNRYIKNINELKSMRILKKWKKKHGDFRIGSAIDMFNENGVWCSFDRWSIKIGYLR